MKTLFRSKIRFVLIPVMAVAFLFLVGFLVMHLWNYTLPVLFGVSAINLWQSLALFLLCKILFGFGGGGPRRGGPPWRRKAMRRKFDQMDEEGKARVRAYMRSRSHCWGGMAYEPDRKTDDGETQQRD